MFHLGNAKKNLLVSPKKENRYYEEQITIRLDDSNDSHAIIASHITKGSTCLDVGCAVGYIGEILKREKECMVDGIEIDPEALEIAKKKECYQNLFDFSVTDEQDPRYLSFFRNKKKYDYIIFADILEHLPDPGKVLYEFSKKLTAQGSILISLPNIAHMDISKNLIDRTFNYNVTGLLDNTHLRFFTKNSFLEMVEAMNALYYLTFQPTIIGKTIVVPSYATSYPNLYKILDQDGELCVLQYIYELKVGKVAKKASRTTPNYYAKIEKQLEEKEIQGQEINVLREREKELMDQLQMKQREIEKILNSTSWKITEPLRKIKRGFKR